MAPIVEEQGEEALGGNGELLLHLLIMAEVLSPEWGCPVGWLQWPATACSFKELLPDAQLLLDVLVQPEAAQVCFCGEERPPQLPEDLTRAIAPAFELHLQQAFALKRQAPI
eukprot:1758426-Lingulodinium_polyedra.AAC.1